MRIHLMILLTICFTFILQAQNIPVDFEEQGFGADWAWRTFENDTDPALEIIPNPDPTGINTSATVAKFTALPAGQPFAGCETLHGSDIGSFTIDASNSIIRIMVWKSVISDVGIKLVRADNWSLGEIKIANTKVNEWEQIEFDFSSHMGNVYDQMVIFPDFKDRNTENIIYFDNVYGGAVDGSSTEELSDINLKLFPNPTSEILNLRADEHLETYEIIALSGRVELIGKVNSKQLNINVANLAKGVYFVKIKYQEEFHTRKFIKI